MRELIKRESYRTISDDVNIFVEAKLKNYQVKGIEEKTIHDPIWGSNKYSEWEMQIIDSPLIQRLRSISQVGLAVLTYPAARHSRFEHTLGVAAAAKRLVDRINANCENFSINPEIKNKLVLAALMHDVGHCFFSHLSETIYGNLKDFVELRNDIKEIFGVKPKAHEILSLLIVNSSAFKTFFSNTVSYPYKSNVDKLLSDVGKIIIGVNIEENKQILSYQTAIINGSFDVDKLDYIKRDSYTAGLALDFDIERLFTKIQVHTLSDSDGRIEYRLVIQANGVTAIEELTFCKIMLFSYIYYHQKVLITEDIIKDYVQALLKLDLINSYADFLNLDEASLLALAEKQGDKKPFPKYGNVSLAKLAESIKNRNLPKRCLEISQSIIQNVVEEPEKEDKCSEILNKIRTDESYSVTDLDIDINKMISFYTRSNERYIAGFMSRFESSTFDQILEIRKEIYDTLIEVYKENRRDVDFDVFDIYFVFPSIVSYGTPGEKNVLGKDGNLMSVNDFVKLEQWASSFNAYKWRGYVYVSNKVEKEYALEACRKVIFDNKISLDELKAYLKM